jgi:hypothetical protein
MKALLLTLVLFDVMGIIVRLWYMANGLTETTSPSAQAWIVFANMCFIGWAGYLLVTGV